MKNILIIGASRGLGDAFSIGLPDKGDSVSLVSRSEPASVKRNDGVTRSWVKADLADASAEHTISKSASDLPIDIIIRHHHL